MNDTVMLSVQSGRIRAIYAGEEALPRGEVNGYKLEEYAHGPAIISDAKNDEYDPGLTREEVNNVLRKYTGRSLDENAFKAAESMGNQAITVSRNSIEFREHPSYKITEISTGRDLSVDESVKLVQDGTIPPDKLFNEAEKAAAEKRLETEYKKNTPTFAR